MNESNDAFLNPSKGSPERGRKPYSSFYPLLLILLTLDLVTVRDTFYLYRHRSAVRLSNAQATERLQKTSEKAAFVEKMRQGLTELALTDPVAERIKTEFFPAQPPSLDPKTPLPNQ